MVAEAQQAYDAFLTDVATPVTRQVAGALKAEVDILDGLERAPEALIGMLDGNNRGKRAVRVS